MFAKSCSMGLEGVVSKLSDSAYREAPPEKLAEVKMHQAPGIRDYRLHSGPYGSEAIVALHLGYYQNDQMKYAGKVGTGFGMKDAQGLYDRLAKLGAKIPAVNAACLTAF